MVRRPNVSSVISFLRGDATLVVTPDASLSITFFLRKDATTVRRPDAILVTSFVQIDATLVVRPDTNVSVLLSS